MAKAVALHEKDEIAAFLGRNPALHLYAIGDLDDFFWPYTSWYALREGGQVTQLALLYFGTNLPVLLAHAAEPAEGMGVLLRSLLPLLPRRLYAHLSAGQEAIFAGSYHVRPHGAHLKMALADRSRLEAVDTGAAVRLSAANLGELEALYRASYPGNWFDPRMLETGHYYGLRDGDALASVAGVHVYSPRYQVAALGNITTRPELRGRGLATVVTAKLCRELLGSVDQVGLNVAAANVGAIGCYERLGFERVAEYGEYMLELI